MSVIVRQHPTSPNMANNHLVYQVDSNQDSQPQHKIVMDIKDGNDVLLQRVKQSVGPNGVAVFDIGQIMTQYVGPAKADFDLSSATLSSNVGMDIKVYFGEQYATSLTGTVTLYTGAGGAGEPSVTPKSYVYIFDGAKDDTEGASFNYDKKHYNEENATDDGVFNHQNALTDFVNNRVTPTDHHSLTFFQGNADGNVDATNAQDIFSAIITQYDAQNVLLSTSTIYNLTLRQNSSQAFADVVNNQNGSTRMVSLPVGPGNGSFALEGDCTEYKVLVCSQATDRESNESGIWGTYWFKVEDCVNEEDKTRFAWQNKYGGWDFFTFIGARTASSNIERMSYKQSFVDYTGQEGWNPERRGETTLVNKIQRRFGANTDYLTKAESELLVGLYYSNNVYVEENGNYYPVVITSADVTERTNPRTQKLFSHQVEYRMSNTKANRQ